jgi:hypothetical protein
MALVPLLVWLVAKVDGLLCVWLPDVQVRLGIIFVQLSIVTV